ncbi:hypothetical protein [Halorubrum depositum]|uniref:hypothetical protein n=1 Tax=Halorubrum depositum TaxID=2583992 RepID=UPI0011A112E5|nr:hypothetical protein [Halorubrum depositum]
MIGDWFRDARGDDDSVSDDDPSKGLRVALFDRRRTDRASVNGKVRYVFLGAMGVIGTAIVANVVF